MKIIPPLVTAAVLAFLAFFIYEWVVPRAVHAPAPEVESGAPSTLQTYRNESRGLSFEYPESYVLDERAMPGRAQREHISIVLTRKADLPPPRGGEGPPSISIDLYQNNRDGITTEQWIRNTSASNFKLSPDGQIIETAVDGKKALMYRFDGLYQGTTIALSTKRWVYVFTVTYLTPQDDLVQEYARIMQTVRISEAAL